MTKVSRCIIVCGSFAGILSPLLAAPTLAQDAQDARDIQETQGTEDSRSLLGKEIVVTAQKRAQNVQDVGISISTFSGD